MNFKNEKYPEGQTATSAEEVFFNIKNGVCPDMKELKFLNPNAFVAGQVHTRINEWKKILLDSNLSDDVMD